MLQRPFNQLKQQLETDQIIWLGVSGGLDSCVLFDLAIKTIPKQQLRVIHINHQISTQADQWQAHVTQLAYNKNIRLIIETADTIDITQHNIEDSARQFRYQAFKQHVKPHDILLLAHHADDQVETVIMRLFQGAGPHGLSGMRESTYVHHMHVIRPLLNIAKKQLTQYAIAHNLNWIDDDSNTNTCFTRNHIRAHILPTLRQSHPHLDSALTRAAQHCHEQQQWIETQLLLPRAGLLQQTVLPFETFLREAPFAQKIILRAWLIQHTGYPPSTKQMMSILTNVIHARADKNPEHQHMQWIISRFNKQLFLRTKTTPKPLDCYNWLCSADTFYIPELNLTLHKPLNHINKAPYNQDLTIRFRTFGERFHPYNRVGSRPLKKCMQEWCIPPWQRNKIPLIYHDNTLVCVADYATAHIYGDIPHIYSNEAICT